MAGRLSPEDRQRLEGKEQNVLPSLKESCDLPSSSCGGKCRPTALSTAIGHSAALLVPLLKEETFPLLCSHFHLCRSLQMKPPSLDQHGKVIFGSSEALGWVSWL